MKNSHAFLKCNICSNIVRMTGNADSKLSCCGQEMILMMPNIVETSIEKHTSVLKLTKNKLMKNKLIADVNSVPHPMTIGCHISCISTANDSLPEHISLEKTDEPTTTFLVDDE